MSIWKHPILWKLQNLNGVFYGIKYAAIRMKMQGKGGAIVSTSSIEGFIGDPSGKEGIRYLISLHPLGRLGTSEEIAHGVIFLIENEYVTGFNLLIDGGYTAQ